MVPLKKQVDFPKNTCNRFYIIHYILKLLFSHKNVCIEKNISLPSLVYESPYM